MWQQKAIVQGWQCHHNIRHIMTCILYSTEVQSRHSVHSMIPYWFESTIVDGYSTKLHWESSITTFIACVHHFQHIHKIISSPLNESSFIHKLRTIYTWTICEYGYKTKLPSVFNSIRLASHFVCVCVAMLLHRHWVYKSPDEPFGAANSGSKIGGRRRGGEASCLLSFPASISLMSYQSQYKHFCWDLAIYWCYQYSVTT